MENLKIKESSLVEIHAKSRLELNELARFCRANSIEYTIITYSIFVEREDIHKLSDAGYVPEIPEQDPTDNYNAEDAS